MNQEQISRRYKNVSAEMQARILATFGHNLTIAARDTYEFQAPGVRTPQRLRDINEIQHHVFAQILALRSVDGFRYPDDVLLAILLEHDDDHLREQSVWALADALERIGE